LAAIDTRAPWLAAQALLRSMRHVQCARVVLFTHAWPGLPPDGVDVVDIDRIQSGADYSDFVLQQLPGHVHTAHVLLTQWDGFVVNAAAWTDEFLQHDYIGAVWPEQPEGRNVGNGGFSLRSRRLMDAGRDARITPRHPEDVALCRTHRGMLEADYGIRFAPSGLARRFAHENEAHPSPTFGFHGPRNLPRWLDEPVLARWLEELPPEFYRSRDARRLARALLAHGMPDTARRVVRHRQQVGRSEPATRLIGWAAWASATARRWTGQA
jgi:hypothetical protein